VAAIVLEVASVSQYPDRPTSYTFPERYINVFRSFPAGHPIRALIYEPRGDDAKGRMAYLGIARISSPPQPTSAKSRNGQRLWEVRYDGPATPFDQAVPREVDGEPVEALLRAMPRGIRRNQATRGRAVRLISDDDFQRICLIGSMRTLELTEYPTIDDHADLTTQVRERTERLVLAIERSARFRTDVTDAYGKRCAVSGFSVGPVSPFVANRFLDAAHIRPVGRDGPDSVANGLPLTPTLHRLFDAGMFTVVYEQGRPILQTSPHLEPEMISGREGRFDLPLRDGLALITPADPRLWPSKDQVLYHQRRIYRGP
jgi:putative restriction endonuclease